MPPLILPHVAMLVIGIVFTTASMLWVQPTFGSGIARRDAVRANQYHQQNAMKFAQDAVVHGKQGHAEAVVTNADAALQHAVEAGKGPHVEAGIGELKQAIEHGKAGHADAATTHAEQAVMHLSEQSSR